MAKMSEPVPVIFIPNTSATKVISAIVIAARVRPTKA